MAVGVALVIAPGPARAEPMPSPTASASSDASAVPEPDPAASTPPTSSPSPSPTGGGDATGPAIDDTFDTGLEVGIDRYITYPSTATAVGSNGLATTTLAIPLGMVPIQLRGELVSLADNPGIVRVRVGTSFIEMDATDGGRFSLPVPADAVVDRNLTVEVRNTLDDGGERCSADFTSRATITDLSVGFIGRETPPETIAGFFSPPVKKVTIIIPDEVSPAVAQAAMATAGAVARRYDRTVPIIIMSVAQASSDPTVLVDADGPNRIVRLLPTSDEAVSVAVTNPGVPTLSISGDGDALSAAGAALSTTALGLGAVPDATDLSQGPQSAPTSALSLADLGVERPTLFGLGRLTASVNVPQDRFGGPTGAFTIRIEGANTPVPPGAQATASLLWNDQLVQSQVLGDSDDYLAEVTVSGPLVRRANTLTLRVDATPSGGDCSIATQPFQMDIDGFASTVTAQPGQTLAPGFTRFPQAVAGRLVVAFGSGQLKASHVVDACGLVVALQRSGNVQLEVVVEDFASFLTAPNPGLVVGATPDDANALSAPLRFEPWRAVRIGGAEFELTVDGPFAALEAFDLEGRNILLLGGTTGSPPELMRQLVDEAQNGEFGWDGLAGDLLVAQPGAEPLSLTSDAVVPQAAVVEESRSIPVWWLAVGAAVVGILLARWWAVVRRRRRIEEKIAAATEAWLLVPDEPEPPDDDPSGSERV